MAVFWEPVASSWVVAIGFDLDTDELYVEFKDGAICIYQSSESEYEDFYNASSYGQWVHANIYGRSYRRG